MTIFIDTSPLRSGHAVRGIGRYTRELVAALKRLNSPHTFLTSDDQRPSQVDIVHYPFFDLFFPTLPLIKKTKTIVTIHDVIPLVFPQHYAVGIRGSLALARQRLALSSVSHVITDSHCSARDIEERLHVQREKISAIALAPDETLVVPKTARLLEVKKKYQLPKKYILYVGDMNYNKNLIFLLHVAAKVPNIHFVMVGSQLNNTAIPEGKELHETIVRLGLRERVHIMTQVPSDGDELACLYSQAQAYIQPSLYEGFGLPILEAMRCKVPVISSCGGSLPEVYGNFAKSFHPRDEEDCVHAIREVLSLDERARKKMILEAYEWSQTFSWEKTAKATLTVYEMIKG